jgi:hypothetical protein
MNQDLTPLHYVPVDEVSRGPCAKCGKKVWKEGGVYTSNYELWETPPEGYQRCTGLAHDRRL